MISEVLLCALSFITNQHVSYLLQNLFLLHDPTFDDELRRAAVYISDRHILFKLVEEAHYRLIPQQKQVKKPNRSFYCYTDSQRGTGSYDLTDRQFPGTNPRGGRKRTRNSWCT